MQKLVSGLCGSHHQASNTIKVQGIFVTVYSYTLVPVPQKFSEVYNNTV